MRTKLFILLGTMVLISSCAAYRKPCNYCSPYMNDNPQCGYCTPCNNYFPCIDDVSNCHDAPCLYRGVRYVP